MTMAEVVTAFERELQEMIRQGREQGIRQGREQGRASVLQQMAARKFGLEAAGVLSRILDQLPDRESLDRITDAILECDASDEFIARLGKTCPVPQLPEQQV